MFFFFVFDCTEQKSLFVIFPLKIRQKGTKKTAIFKKMVIFDINYSGGAKIDPPLKGIWIIVFGRSTTGPPLRGGQNGPF